MPHYFVVDARFSFSTDLGVPQPNSGLFRESKGSTPGLKSRRPKPPRARSGSISIPSFSSFPQSPVNRLAQSMGPRSHQQTKENAWSRHTTPAMSSQRGDFYFDYKFEDSWDQSYRAKSNRRSVWQRFTENVDKCVFRIASKFYK
ncbi:unnamed protein product [Phytophthora fragariaefolia]|uniref:Unnamed protein product n=1 Tax=Phytophthora fragariaefolia TaxID=1490495 RepID=A0A9W7CPF9_9STRA|nr:unnamed protein product [Phytophthora fragariaefolia]